MTHDKATVELLPCPFCGCEDIIRVAYEGDDDYAQLRCDKCLAMGPLKDEIGDWQRPYKSWNTRSLPTPTDASGVVEALEMVDTKFDSYRDAKAPLDEGLARFVKDSLAQHRAGNPWSDEVPTVPGAWWWKDGYSDRVIREMANICGEICDNRSGVPAYQIKGQWCKATPPEGS